MQNFKNVNKLLYGIPQFNPEISQRRWKCIRSMWFWCTSLIIDIQVYILVDHVIDVWLNHYHSLSTLYGIGIQINLSDNGVIVLNTYPHLHQQIILQINLLSIDLDWNFYPTGSVIQIERKICINVLSKIIRKNPL